MRDRRKFHRWDCSLGCYCWGEGFEFKAILTNLSFNGARVYFNKKLPAEGSEIQVAILPEKTDVPDEETKLKARVVAIYDEGECFGIEFYGKWDERVEILMPVFQRYIKSD
jgi:PilZ domain